MIKGDKIRLKIPMGAFTNVGEVCGVTDVTEGGVISFKFGGDHLGCMSYDEFEKYFELVEVTETPTPKREWNEWESGFYTITKLNGADEEIIVEYRHNGKRVQVKHGGLKARSTCHDGDEFDLTKGLLLAVRRLMVKVLENDNKIFAKSM